MEKNRVIVDTNILFVALLERHTKAREHLLSIQTDFCDFFCPRFVMVELFKHKERIAEATELDENELLELLNSLLSRIRFVDEGLISIGTWIEARRLCADVDLKDAPFVAHTLYLDGLLWTLDSELEIALRARGFDRFFKPGPFEAGT